MTGNGKTITYKYNASGIRTQKIVNGVTTTYHLVGDKVTFETNGTDNIYYTYDASDSLVSMNLNGVEYYYIRNIQGDIIGLHDNDGVEVVNYSYDSWGKLISTTGADASTVGVKNPYRYRGYHYDTETSLYYLQSRYYNADWGRFINADTIVVVTGDLLSANMFAYCNNDPVNLSDPDGHFAVQALCAAIGSVAGWYFGDYVAKKLGYSSGPKYWAIRAGVTVGGAVIGWFAGPTIVNIARNFLLQSPKVMAKMSNWVLKGLGILQSCCFTADTLISTKEGEKPIEQIEEGDLVYSENPETGEKGLKPVVKIFKRQVNALVHIYVNDKVINTTDEHPFWVVGLGWVAAKDLEKGDSLKLQDGKTVVVSKVAFEEMSKPVNVYNFEVSDWHTYYVTDSNILVHNACSLQKVSNSLLKASKLDAHAIKYEYLGKGAQISLYDLYYDKATKIIYILEKGTKQIVEKTYHMIK